MAELSIISFKVENRTPPSWELQVLSVQSLGFLYPAFKDCGIGV